MPPSNNLKAALLPSSSSSYTSMADRPSSRRSNHQRPDADGVFSHEAKESNGNETLPAPATYDEFKRNQKKKDKGPGFEIKESGESGRRGIHPWHFLRIAFRSTSRASMVCNVLWPVVPTALAVRYALPEQHVAIFTLAYIAMVPCANLIGFAGQEFARKVPHVFGVLLEITCGSIVEIVLFMILLKQKQFLVIKAAILGSILATMLLCLGLCFLVGGMRREEQTFSDAISEAGSGILLTAGVVLVVPTAFAYGITSTVSGEGGLTPLQTEAAVLNISRIIAVLLIIAYGVYVYFQAHTHHGIYDAIFEYDEHRDHDKEKDEAKAKLTMTECIVALIIAVALVSIIAYTLVHEIEFIIKDGGVSDAFMGLILVPLVEKFAEHLTAIDEAWDNQMNFALSHVLGATIQTALFNAPLAVIVSWGLHKNAEVLHDKYQSLDLNFDIFNLVMLVLAILTVGRFLQDQRSNYLEGSLLVILYIAIAVSAWYIPNPTEGGEAGGEGGGEGHGGEVGHVALRMLARSLI